MRIQTRVRNHRKAAGLTLDEFAAQIGDPGGQYHHWECGSRGHLPLRLRVVLSQRTGWPLRDFVSAEEYALAKELVVLIARDAAP